MKNKLNIEQILKRAKNRPKTVKNHTINAKVSFTQEPHGAFDDSIAALNLERGNTLAAYGKFTKIPIEFHGTKFFAVDKMADWFEWIKINKVYKLKLKVLYGEIDPTITHPYVKSTMGFLITEVEEDRSTV